MFVLSLDLELHWGMFDRLGVNECREQLLAARDLIPTLLETIVAFGVRATWAIVGMLLFDSKRELLDALPQRRPAYAVRRLSAYEILDQVGEDERADPLHYAASLARRIAATPGQEVATHTFSHYYCCERGQSPADFRADLEAAVEVTKSKLGIRPRSLVFPRNQVALSYLDVCRDLGILAYRGNPDAWRYAPRRRQEESVVLRALRLADSYLPLTGGRAAPIRAQMVPVNVRASQYLRPVGPRCFEPLRLRRIMAQLRPAARRGRIFHLWWHPHDFGTRPAENLAALRRVLSGFARLRDEYGMQSVTMAEAADRILAEHAAS